MESNLKEHIKGLPDDCRLIPVNGKVPIEVDWRNKTYNLEEICKIKKTGIGMLQGEKGEGFVFPLLLARPCQRAN